MIYLEKKSIVELPKATGSISDTLNVEDKVKNAPSINLVTQMTGIPQDGIIAYDGDIVPEGYDEIELDQSITDIVVSSSTPTTGEKVWIQKGKNILIPFNKTAVISNDNDTFTFQADLPINWYGCIAKAELEANTEFTISCSNSIGYGRIGLSTIPAGTPDNYEPDTNLSAGILTLLNASKTSATFISNKKQTVYLMYCSDSSRENLSSFTTSLQIEQGPEATEYEPYIENKIFVKNDNEVYEELVIVSNINKIHYSTEEQLVGTWRNGKPLYRKTIPFTTGTSYAQWLQHAHGIPNVDHIIVTSPTYLWDGEENVSLPDQHTQFGANGTYIRYVLMTEGSNYGNKPIWVTVEYTKTTD